MRDRVALFDFVRSADADFVPDGEEVSEFVAVNSFVSDSVADRSLVPVSSVVELDGEGETESVGVKEGVRLSVSVDV